MYLFQKINPAKLFHPCRSAIRALNFRLSLIFIPILLQRHTSLMCRFIGSTHAKLSSYYITKCYVKRKFACFYIQLPILTLELQPIFNIQQKTLKTYLMVKVSNIHMKYKKLIPGSIGIYQKSLLIYENFCLFVKTGLFTFPLPLKLRIYTWQTSGSLSFLES